MLYNFAYLCYDSAGFTRLGSKKFRKGKTTMKKTLAIVLALAMVLCMIPAAFAATATQTITDGSYNIKAYVAKANQGFDAIKDAEAKNANSLTVKYEYEKIDAVTTGKFTEDKKMAIIEVTAFTKFDSVESVTIDGKELKVNDLADYYTHVGYVADGQVNFPVELTKAGYTDSYVITVKGKSNSIDTVETAKITLKLVNTSEYKTAKTATITSIASQEKKLDAYIVGSKIYLDYAANAVDYADGVKITFADENGAAFSKVTWAKQTTCDVAKSGAIICLDKEKKLDKSATKFTVNAATAAVNPKYFTNVKFHLETADGLYETKAYTVVVRTDIKEEDPKGIYFAESTKTIKVGESYTPVVMGVATGKKVNATLDYGKDKNTVKVNAQIVDIDGEKVIGTKEGVAYITASYETYDGLHKYTASSMKIIVAGEAAEVAPAGTTTYYVTCRTLNVRKGAGTSYAKAGKLHRGDKVEVVSISKNWAKLANGTYVSAKYIAK